MHAPVGITDVETEPQRIIIQIPVCRGGYLAHDYPISHTKYLSRTRNTHLAHDYPISHTITPISYTITPISYTITPSRTRFQSRSRWVFCCKWSKIDWMSMNEEKARTGIRVREVEKSHSTRIFSKGRGAKKKDPNCIQIRVLLWQITLIWIPMHPTSLPGVHFGMRRGAFNYRVGCKLLRGGVHLAEGGVHFGVGGVHFQSEGCIRAYRSQRGQSPRPLKV